MIGVGLWKNGSVWLHNKDFKRKYMSIAKDGLSNYNTIGTGANSLPDCEEPCKGNRPQAKYLKVKIPLAPMED